MAKYLEFDGEHKNYKPFSLTRENIRANVGKKICFVIVNPYSYEFRYGTIHSVRYNRLFLNDIYDEFHLKDIYEAGILKD